jgi:hypothetical protein
MALLLTSSSLARSLIRTLLIRPFLCSAMCLSLHCTLTESPCLHSPVTSMSMPGAIIRLILEPWILPARCVILRRPANSEQPAFSLRQLRIPPRGQSFRRKPLPHPH